MTDVAEIARRLTKAQREAVRQLLPHPEYGFVFRMSTPLSVIVPLFWSDLIGAQWTATPLAIEVRAHLLTQEQPR